MKLQIDNLDGLGPRDYTASIDGSRLPQVFRKINQPSELRFSLVGNGPDFVVPAVGARVTLGQANGQDVFTGFLMQAPLFEYLGWGERGPIYRYTLIAQSDEALLDEKRPPDRCPFVDRSAGSALRQLTQDLLPGVFATGAVQDLDLLAGYAPRSQKAWSQQAAEIAVQARACYRTMDGTLTFAPVGASAYPINEGEPNFTPGGLRLQPVATLINDATVTGETEPQAYVKDYFVGDGLTTRFYLSQTPFTKGSRTVFDEEYAASPLRPTLWSVADPAHAVAVNGGKLQISGGTGADGATAMQFVEKVEMGGALVMQHGDVMFSGASTGVLGGLYVETISVATCLAGFRVAPAGGQSNLQALINGAPTGPVVSTAAAHHYQLTTRMYSQEIYRQQQIFHSSLHPAGDGIGGAEITADVRIVLEIHDIDPADPGTQVAPSTVLYDGLISGAPGFCTYAPVNAASLHCTVAFTRLLQAADTEVRSALPGEGYRTRLVGPLSQGAECNVTSSAELAFYSSCVPAANELIVVRYRGSGRALARVTNPASVASQRRGIDDGVHGAVRHVKSPRARTSMDCENAARALLDDSTGAAWSGEYETWSDFLPGDATDVFPGDRLAIDAPSRNAAFQAIVREVGIAVRDLRDDHSIYTIKFANDSADSLSFEFEESQVASWLDVAELANTQVGGTYLPDLTTAEITQVTSTTVTVDTGISPPAGGGFEVRWSDTAWGPDNDRNLVGRFTSQAFNIPRLSRVQNCYLRQYDASTPPKYSRYTAALHVDYPL